MLVAASKRPWFPAFRSTLAIAGVDGTVRRRMAGTRAQGNVTAKTGSLRNVSALAGYVTSADGEPLVFSFISNGPGGSGYKVSENIACIALADFSYARPAGGVTPVPLTLTDPSQKDAEDEAGYAAGAATRPPSASSVPQPTTPSTTPPVTRPVTPPPVQRAITPTRKAPAPPARRMRSSRRGSRKQTWRRSSKRGSKPSLRKQSRARKQPPKQRNRRRR